MPNREDFSKALADAAREARIAGYTTIDLYHGELHRLLGGKDSSVSTLPPGVETNDRVTLPENAPQ